MLFRSTQTVLVSINKKDCQQNSLGDIKMEKQSKNFPGHTSDEAFILWLYDEFKPIMFATAGKYVNNSSD